MSTGRVLVVEDDPANLELTVAILEMEGVEVCTAATADEAMRRIGAERPDLILMDVQLPGRTGHDITRDLKAAPATCGIPVVAVTAQAMRGDREKALAAGCDDYCAKPIDADRLRSILQRYLSAHA
jgi:two-component system, cell cycle response regulator DivK